MNRGPEQGIEVGEATRRQHAGARGRWLIHAGAVLNALLFVTADGVALYYAARNAQTEYFVIVLLVTTCALLASVGFVMALRRGNAGVLGHGGCQETTSDGSAP